MSLTDLEKVKKDGFELEFVKIQTNEICLEAVKQNGYALQYVKEQTNEICLEAVKQKGYALELVDKQTEEICLEAVKQNYDASKYIKDNKILLSAIKINGCVLKYIKKQTKEICLEAIKNNNGALRYVDIKYVKYVRNFLNLDNLDENYKFIINKDKKTFINNLKKKYIWGNIYLKKKYIWGIKYLNQDLKLCKFVLNLYDYNYLLMKEYLGINYKLILNNSKRFSYINFKKIKLCLQIIKTFSYGFQHINKQYIENLL